MKINCVIISKIFRGIKRIMLICAYYTFIYLYTFHILSITFYSVNTTLYSISNPTQQHGDQDDE